MSGALSTSFIVSSVSITSNQQVYNSRSLSGKRQARLGSQHTFAIEIQFADMLRDEFQQLYAFLLKQKGMYDTFTITIPGHTSPLGTWPGTPAFFSKTNDNTIIGYLFTANQTGAVKAGDFFTIGGNTKVYCVTADGNTNGSGAVSIAFEPALVFTPTLNAALTRTNVSMTVQADENSLSFTRSGLIYTGITLRCTEAGF